MSTEPAPSQIKDYKLIRVSKSICDDLPDKVREEIQMGWQPFGGPMLLNESVAQAMVRHVELPKPAATSTRGHLIALSRGVLELTQLNKTDNPDLVYRAAELARTILEMLNGYEY